MAHVKAGGTAKNLRDSNPKYLGLKKGNGQKVQAGQIIVRQRGTKFRAGENTKVGKDHTIFATSEGVVKFSSIRHKRFDGKTVNRKLVSVINE